MSLKLDLKNGSTFESENIQNIISKFVLNKISLYLKSFKLKVKMYTF